MKIEKIKAKSISYGARRSLSSVKYIVIHYTGNDGDTAQGNGKYFANGNTRTAGAHFFVSQDGSVVESIPMELVAWSVGGSYGSGAPYNGKCTNNNSVSIELCDNASRGPSEKQTAAVKELVAYIRKSCKNASTIVRHWDVNRKSCPGPYLLNESHWKTFVAKISGGKAPTIEQSPTERGQSNANTFVVEWLKNPPQISVDGIRGPQTRKQAARCVQIALNKDFNAGLAVDGIIGPKSRAALSKKCVKRGDKSYLVLAVKIAYQCAGKDAGLKYSKTFGSGLEKTAGKKSISYDDILSILTL